MNDYDQVYFWAHMLDECFNKHMLTEGKHWPEDYIKTAYNLIKSSKLGQASWYTDEYIKKDLDNIVQDFTPLAHKNSNLGFFMAIIRWFIEYSGSSQRMYQEFLELKLNNVIKALLKISNDKSYDSQREQIKKMSFEQFMKLANKIETKASTEEIQTAKTNAKYNVIPIYSYEELYKAYGGNVTGYKGKSEWCHANGKSTYDDWTKNGTQMFFVIQSGNWKKITAPEVPYEGNSLTYPEYSCYDQYGMSLIAILVDVNSNKLLNSTSRWNHIILPKSGAADTMFESWAQLNKAIGLDVEKTCKDKCADIKTKIEARSANANKAVQKILAKVNIIDNNTIPEELKLYVTSIAIPDNIIEIENGAFKNYSRLTSVTIPNSVTRIGNYAFDRCSSLISVMIPDSVESIGGYAFYGCSGLTNVTIPDSVTRIEASAFLGCDGLTSVTIPDSVESIGDWAFEFCDRLADVTIGNNVTSIGEGAFDMCKNLKSVFFKGKTLKQVKAMKFYPWGIEDDSIIKTKK